MTPTDSRYIPFSQQPYCCVPTCLQMVLYKNSLPLWPQEVIGAQLGLVVPPEEKKYFWNVPISQDVPIAGYGTRIQEPEFTLENFVANNGLAFAITYTLCSKLANAESLRRALADAQAANKDVLVCFRSGAVYDNDRINGHVCVFDTIDADTVRVVDPAPNAPKWRTLSVQKLFTAIQLHEDKRMGGLWIFERLT